MLDITQQELADAVGVSRPYIASVESGRANPSLDVVERIAGALGLQLELRGQAPVTFNSPRQRDLVHARCSGYVDRRLAGAGWLTRREVTIVRGRMRGWIDLLAFDPRRRILLVVEIKTWLDDPALWNDSSTGTSARLLIFRSNSAFDRFGLLAGCWSWRRPRLMPRSARTVTQSTADSRLEPVRCAVCSPRATSTRPRMA